MRETAHVLDITGIPIRTNDLVSPEAIVVTDAHGTVIGLMREKDGWAYLSIEGNMAVSGEMPPYARWVMNSRLLDRLKQAQEVPDVR